MGREEEPYFLTELVTPFRLSTICAAWRLKHSPSSRGSSVTSLVAIRQSRRTTIAPYRHYTRPLQPRITPDHYPGGAIIARRGSRLAPYRHYTRALHPLPLPPPAPTPPVRRSAAEPPGYQKSDLSETRRDRLSRF